MKTLNFIKGLFSTKSTVKTLKSVVKTYMVKYPDFSLFFETFEERFKKKSEYQRKLVKYIEIESSSEVSNKTLSISEIVDEYCDSKVQTTMLVNEVDATYPGFDIWYDFINDLEDTDFNDDFVNEQEDDE